MTRHALSKPVKARGSPKKTSKKRVASKAVRAVISHDYDVENPFQMWDQFGTLVICDTRNYSVNGAIGPEDLEEFCNARFDVDRMLEEVWTEREHDVGEYVKKYGALVSYVDGGFIIAGHDQIVKEYGYDNSTSRAKAQALIDTEAREYRAWADGETYQYHIYDDHTDDASQPDEVVFDQGYGRHGSFGEYVDGVGGYIGDEDYVESEAREALTHYVRETYGREPNLVSQSRRSRCGSPRKGTASKSVRSKPKTKGKTKGRR